MKRRTFIHTGMLCGGAAALAACSSGGEEAPEAARAAASDYPKITWRIATSWPTNLPLLSTPVQRLAESLRAMSNGNFSLRVDTAGKHKAPTGVFDFVREGQYEMGHSASYYWKGKDVATVPFTTMPFGMVAQEMNAWFWYGGGVELMNEIYARHGMYSWPGGNSGLQMGGWFRREIRSLGDLQGLKMRIPGLAGEILARLGVIPVNIPPGELYTALERNVIDALEWVNPYMDVAMGFQQIAKYYYTGWHEPSASTQFLINRQSYAALPPVYQEMLQVAVKEAAFDMLCESVYRNAEVWADFAAQYPDVRVLDFPPDILAELRRQTALVVNETAEQSPDFARVLRSQEQFLAAAKEWTAISELHYLDIR